MSNIVNVVIPENLSDEDFDKGVETTNKIKVKQRFTISNLKTSNNVPKLVFITDSNKEGWFLLDETDTTSVGDDINIIVTSTGKRYKKKTNQVLPTGTSSQVILGDKTLGTLNKSLVGLSNVDNTSDLSKPVSTATQTELDTITSNVSTATTTANLAKTTADTAIAIVNSSNLQGIDLGVWDASTNTPTLTSTPLNTLVDGSFYTVTIAGTQSITGSSTAFSVRDIVKKFGTTWVRIPNVNRIDNAGDVFITDKQDGDVIQYDSVSGLFLNKPSTFTENTNPNSQNLVWAKTSKSGKVIIAVNYKGEIINIDYQALKSLVTNIQTKAESANLATLSLRDTNPNQLNLVKSWTGRNGELIFGFDANGNIHGVVKDKIATTYNNLIASETTLILGDSLFVIAGEEYQLYTQSMLKSRLKDGFEVALQSKGANNKFYQKLSDRQLNINADKLGATAEIILKNKTLNLLKSRTINVYKAITSKAATPKICVLGDSISARVLDKLATKFAGTSVTPTWIGSRKESVIWGEGRGGWEAGDFTYIVTDNSHVPLPTGQESIAIGLGNDTRNPFIRTAVGGDIVGNIKNGYIFDWNYYLSRFSFSTPDIVLINLGTNDLIRRGTITGIANTLEGIRIIVETIKTQRPSTKIILYIPNTHAENEVRWNTGLTTIFQNYIEIYGNRQAEGIYLLSAHTYTLSEYVYPTDSVTTDLEKTLSVNDTVHYSTDGFELWADVLFNCIFNLS